MDEQKTKGVADQAYEILQRKHDDYIWNHGCICGALAGAAGVLIGLWIWL